MEVLGLRPGKAKRIHTEDSRTATLGCPRCPFENAEDSQEWLSNKKLVRSRHASRWNFMGIFVKMFVVCQTNGHSFCFVTGV